MFYTVSMADTAVVVIEAITPQLGECIVALQCAGVKSDFSSSSYLQPEQLAPLIKGTLLQNYKFIEEDHTKLRQLLLEMASARSDADVESSGAVPIDHFFNVKGVGTVVLGYVAYGKINKHDTLKALPGGKEVLVRSIQKHDDDFDSAVEGDRVGLALKNIDVEELDRGFVLTKDPLIKVEGRLVGKAEMVHYWKIPMKEGMVVHIGHWMQYVPARIEEVKDEGDKTRPILTLGLERPMVFKPGSKAMITYLEGGKLRIAGTLLLD